FENIIYYKNNDTMQASEIVIVKFKDNKQAANFKEAMLTRIKNQHTIFDGYIEKEETLLNSAIIDLQANYALYVVGEDATAIDKRFVQAL
ncbi:MAG: DUF4358 domain-containing protein, partial [Holdemanella sp.]|nr:DUF4358 domain-containing protein [Holdemanella sp.]